MSLADPGGTPASVIDSSEKGVHIIDKTYTLFWIYYRDS